MSFRRKGTRAQQGKERGLPIASVDHVSQAILLLVHFGKLSYNNRDYTLAGHAGWTGDVDCLFRMEQIFEAEIVRRGWA